MDNRPNSEKIKSIIYDYCSYGDDYLLLSTNAIQEIAKRIEFEVMGIKDDNEFVDLPDLTKNKVN